MVSRATLHNQDFIDQLGLGIGDMILVYKSGEIIPKIKDVVKEKRPEGWKPYRMPDNCPVCGHKLVRDEGGVDFKCVNLTCPGTLVNRVVNFVSRDCMDIKGFGTEYIRKLTGEGYVKDIADIFELRNKREDLIEKGILGRDTNTDKLLAAIESAKQDTPADKVLAGLGIPGVGKATAKELIRTFGSIDDIEGAEKENLLLVQDIGEISAEGIYNFFHDEGNKILLARLKELGLNFAKEESAVQGSALAGLTFCITGTLEGMSRSEAEALIESNGGKPVSSVSRKTSYLLMGADAGSKERKARELGVPIISLDELKELISNG